MPPDDVRDVPEALRRLVLNLKDVAQLLNIHVRVTGSGAGRRFGVEVLNRSALVLLVACWEAFVEDLAKEAFDAMLATAPDHKVFPNKVLALASKSLRSDNDARKVWKLAGDGWKTVLLAHRERVLGESVGKFNTPKSEKVQSLFTDLIGYSDLCGQWSWQGMPSGRAKKRLDELVTRRGEIAHRVTAGASVLKRDVREARRLVVRLAVVTANRIGGYVKNRTGQTPWGETWSGGVR